MGSGPLVLYSIEFWTEREREQYQSNSDSELFNYLSQFAKTKWSAKCYQVTLIFERKKLKREREFRILIFRKDINYPAVTFNNEF